MNEKAYSQMLKGMMKDRAMFYSQNGDDVYIFMAGYPVCVVTTREACPLNLGLMIEIPLPSDVQGNFFPDEPMREIVFIVEDFIQFPSHYPFIDRIFVPRAHMKPYLSDDFYYETNERGVMVRRVIGGEKVAFVFSEAIDDFGGDEQ